MPKKSSSSAGNWSIPAASRSMTTTRWRQFFVPHSATSFATARLRSPQHDFVLRNALASVPAPAPTQPVPGTAAGPFGEPTRVAGQQTRATSWVSTYRPKPTKKLKFWMRSVCSRAIGTAKSKAIGAGPIAGIAILNPAPTATRKSS